MTNFAIADLTRAVSAGEAVFSIHYACESFYEALDHPPGVSAISVSSVPRATTETFARIDSRDADAAELSLLTRFFDWLRSVPDARLIHWNMNSSDFGFTALRNRYEFLGGTNAVSHAEERTFDLDEVIARRHGTEYASHPRLTTMIGLNGIRTRYTLSGAEQAERYAQGQHAALARSTSERATTIARLAELLVAGNLQTERSGPAVHFGGAMIDSVDLVVAIGARIERVGRQLARRHSDRPTLSLDDEYDYQDLLRTQLAIFFDDVRPEDHAATVAGATTRIDFVLPEFGLAVELKTTRESLSAARLGEELIVDARRYRGNPHVRHLICLVFDPNGRLANPRGLERDLTEPHEGISVTVRIFD